MATWAGTWYTSDSVAKGGPPGFAIELAELHAIARQLPGTPFTYEHRGLSAAARDAQEPSGPAVRSALASAGQRAYRKSHKLADLCMAPVGAITDAWVNEDSGKCMCAGKVLSALPQVSGLISSGRLSGLSLTHAKGTGQPVEITLTSDPAREGCRIVAIGPTAVAQYKRDTRGGGESTMDTTADVSPLQRVMEKLDNADRAMVESRMEEMMTAATTANTAASEAEARAAQLEALGTDSAIIQDQLDMITSQLTERQREVFQIDPEKLGKQMTSNNPVRERGAMRQLLMACSNQMMAQQAMIPEGTAVEPGAKRARTETPAPVEAFSAVATAQPETALAKALASTFEL